MPSFSATRTDAWLRGSASSHTRCKSRSRKANWRSARAASTAKPRPQAWGWTWYLSIAWAVVGLADCEASSPDVARILLSHHRQIEDAARLARGLFSRGPDALLGLGQ